jgi:trehalose-6-phosphatase
MKTIISVDFDGTIANVHFPHIIGEVPDAIETLKELQKHYLIVVWTCRNGSGLEDAVKWMEELGFKPDAVNENPKESLEMHKSIIDAYG